jgi:FkbM family methyltransferase
MLKQNKILNLRRLNASSAVTVIAYLGKKIFGRQPSEKENDLYFFYMHLIGSDGFIKNETDASYITSFRNVFPKMIKLRKKPSSDILVYNQIYGYKEYAPVVKAYNENFNNPAGYQMKIIDAGANIGLTSLYFMESFDATNIISVEPEPKNFEVLKFNLSKTRNSEVLVLNGGIWTSSCKIRIVSDFRDKSDWAFRVEESDDGEGIQAYAINQLIAMKDWDVVDILKIDIEGSEKEIFLPEHSDISFLEKTKCMAIEIHDEFKCRQQIYAILDKYNFSYFDNGESTICINRNLAGHE